VPLAWQAPGTRVASPAVAELQRRLLGLGYSAVGTADGLYGDQTRAAVRAFQQASGLPTGGDVDCATWAALLGAG
jgi:peptidoglycan hydrolase-like protein with peptidoglycan-binding domain